MRPRATPSGLTRTRVSSVGMSSLRSRRRWGVRPPAASRALRRSRLRPLMVAYAHMPPKIRKTNSDRRNEQRAEAEERLQHPPDDDAPAIAQEPRRQHHEHSEDGSRPRSPTTTGSTAGSARARRSTSPARNTMIDSNPRTIGARATRPPRADDADGRASRRARRPVRHPSRSSSPLPAASAIASPASTTEPAITTARRSDSPPSHARPRRRRSRSA